MDSNESMDEKLMSCCNKGEKIWRKWDTKENRSRMRGGGDVGEKKMRGKRAKEENLRGAVTQTHSSPPFAIRGTADRDRVTVSHQS